MQIPRRYTAEGVSPYDGIAFRTSLRPDAAEDAPAPGSDNANSCADSAWITAPESWSEDALRAFAQNGLAARPVPDATELVPDDDLPECLWPRRAAPGAELACETDVRTVFDRVAGALACQGWRAGYFDSEADAEAFFDELRAMMVDQVALPEGGVLASAGLWWAYGIDNAPAGFVTDYRTGAVRRAEAGDIAACAPVIHGVTGEIAAEGGVMDLWRREAAGLAAGQGDGANLSALATGLMQQVEVGDSTARATGRNADTARFLTVDADHPDAARFAEAPAADAARDAAMRAGERLAARHLEAIFDACHSANGAHRLDPATNPALRFALIAAREAMVPWATVERLITLIADGYGREALDELTHPRRASNHDGPATSRALRIDDATLDSAGRDGHAETLLETVSRAAWHSGRTGLYFADTAEGWNPCPADGPVRAAAGDGGAVFLDDTGAPRGWLNIESFAGPQRSLDTQGLSHTARLLTIALDIALGLTAFATPRLAARAWEYRALALSPANIGGALMALGLPYDSGKGRAAAAAATAIISAAATRCSAEMADEMGACPAFARNGDAMLRVLRNHARAAAGVEGGYDMPGWDPVPLRHDRCHDEALAARAAKSWRKAVDQAARSGLRNAQLTAVHTDRAIAALFDGPAGAEPTTALAAFEALPGGGFRRAVAQRLAAGMRALGYTEKQTDEVIRHLVGHGTLARAPGIDHAALRRCGFGETALRAVEDALGGTFDIRFVFSRWTLGETFCTRVLGLDRTAMEADGFDLLNALGFTDADVRRANSWCFGAGGLEGAPHLSTAHVAVFDTAETAGDGRRIAVDGRVRMLAALQPFVSGGVAHGIAMPDGSTPDDCRDALMLGWRLGLKHLVLGRAPEAPAGAYDGGWAAADALYGRLTRERPAATDATAMRAALNVIEGGRAAPETASRITPQDMAGQMSQALALAHTARDVAEGGRNRPGKSSRTSVEAASGATGDAGPSRRQASEPPRSGPSVSSSADVPVEQRQV